VGSAPFTDFLFYMPGTKEKNIEELVKQNPEERGFIEQVSK
jgi:hypothetical protein